MTSLFENDEGMKMFMEYIAKDLAQMNTIEFGIGLAINLLTLGKVVHYYVSK